MTIRYIEDGLERLHKGGLTIAECERVRKYVQKNILSLHIACYKELFLSRGGSESEWDEACKDFLEGYRKSMVIAAGYEFDFTGVRATGLPILPIQPLVADEPIIIGQ